MHRWDAERAIGLDPTIDPVLAADGIDEYFGLALPRLMVREGREAPVGSLLVRAGDTGHEWHVEARDGTIVPASEASAPTATISGRAEHVLLALWRRPVPVDAITVEGDEPGWLGLGGM